MITDGLILSGVRCQVSGVRCLVSARTATSLECTSKASQHPSNFSGHSEQSLFVLDVSETDCDGNLSLKFHKGSVRNRQMVEVLSQAVAAMSFSYVRWYRHSCPPQLTGEPELLVSWKGL
jgi:hypothetical protein